MSCIDLDKATSALPKVPYPRKAKKAPKETKNFLAGASENERANCVRLIRLMRTATSSEWTEGYWLSYFVQWLLHLDADTPEDEVTVEQVTNCLGDMEQLRRWHNWLRAAGKCDFIQEHPALAWIREGQSDGLTAFERSTQRTLRERADLRDMLFAPDPRG